MIQMPHRSVTRFFIPLIDVLLLLFSIFMLLPVVKEEENAEGETRPRLSAEEMADAFESLKRELQRKTRELQEYKDLRVSLDRVKKLEAELERLRKEKQQAFKRPSYVRVIDIDGKTGNISYYDPENLDNPIVPIPDQKTARDLIGRDRKEAGEKFLYYYFLHPRREKGKALPFGAGFSQVEEYRRWFAEVAHSLQERKERTP